MTQKSISINGEGDNESSLNQIVQDAMIPRVGSKQGGSNKKSDKHSDENTSNAWQEKRTRVAMMMTVVMASEWSW